MQFLSRAAALSSGIAVLVVAFGASQALGNSGTLLPLDQYQAGTEQVQNTIVSNGNFENSATDPLSGWTTETGTFQTAAPTGANTSPSVNGNFAAQGPLGNSLQRSAYSQTVTLASNTDYVLSAYLWNFSPQNFDLTLAELRDGNPAHTQTVSLAPADGNPVIDGSRGVFAYTSFNSFVFTAPVTLEVAFEYDANFPFPQGRPNISGQIDNVAITPLGQFVAPQAIPEPGTAACFVGAAVAGCLARRRH